MIHLFSGFYRGREFFYDVPRVSADKGETA